MRSAISLAAILLSLACGAEGSRTVSHPVLEPELTTRVLTADSTHLPGVLHGLGESIRARTPRVRIGSLNGPAGTILARPVSASSLSDGRIVVLDAMASEVRLYGADGEFQSVLLGRGRGPNEISTPLALQVILSRASRGSDTLVVATRIGLKRFAITGTVIEPLGALQPPEIPLPTDGCSTSGVAFVRAGLRPDSGLVARREMRGGRIQRFGSGYRSGGMLTREELSVGPIACVPDAGVAIAFTYLPRIHMYGPDGRESWTTSLPDFVGLAFEEDKQGDAVVQLRSKFDSPGDMVQTLRVIAPDALLLQVGRLEAATPDRPSVQAISRLSTFLISVQTGEGGFVSSAVPQVIGFGNGMLFTVEEAPEGHPVVVGYALFESSNKKQR